MTNASKAAVPNYSKEQEQILRDSSPMNHESAKALAETPEFKGKSWQSIVAKIKNLGLEYTPKPTPQKKAVQTTKTELVAMIQKRLDRNLDGLEKATRGALLLLINGLDHAIPPKAETLPPELGDSGTV